jgi:NAD-dependent DNA ligase
MSLKHPDHASYAHLTKRARFDKAINNLTGLLAGITIDGKLNAHEVAEALNWLEEYSDLIGKGPLAEVREKLNESLADGVIDPDEQEDLLWLCSNLSQDSTFYDGITHSIQQLHGLMHGILADGEITVEEAEGLMTWIDDHTFLKGVYPYDEIDSLLTVILKDGKIDSDEHKMLKAFFEDFIEYSFAKKLRLESERVKSGLSKEFTLPGVCAMCPDITFDGKIFTLTGASVRATRKEIIDKITAKGGSFSTNVTKETEFLVIGSAGNPCWAFSCYGRKVEKAVQHRKLGVPIVIVHESDFWDALEDSN